MKTDLSRRSFIAQGSRACAACCLLLSGSKLIAAAAGDDDTPDPEKFTYCGYRCTPECTLLKATLENDPELKKKTFEDWKMAERRGIEFDPEAFFCYGCKNEEKPKGIIVQKCTIIPCAREKGFDCCFQCKDLAECDKELWVNFPQHRDYVLNLQKSYFATLE
jgi:hypothetical protein